MKRVFRYGLCGLLALLTPALLPSCHDDKDIVVITDELPLKVDHLYMVGDATPAGWSIDNPAEMTRDANDKFVFTYHGRLRTGEMKLPLAKGDWGATFIYAPAAGTEINSQGVASPDISVRKGGDDHKWHVTEAGIYTLTINLRERTIRAVYEGAEPVLPLTTTTLGFIGDATPAGWSDASATMFTKVSDSPLQFTFAGHLGLGEFKLVTDATVLQGYQGPYVQAPEAGVTLSHEGASKAGMVLGGEDHKWRVTEAGTYQLRFDLTSRTITVESFVADPTVDPWETETLYGIGDALRGWDIGGAQPFKQVAAHTFVYAGELKAGSFKLMATNTGSFGTKEKDWFYASGAGVTISDLGVSSPAVVAGDGTSADNQWSVSRAGNYVLTLDMQTHQISALYVGPVGTSIATAEARLVGDATPKGWDITGTPLTRSSASPLRYTWTGHLGTGEFKVALTSTNNDFSGLWLQAPQADTEVSTAGISAGDIVLGGDDHKWKVTTAGTYQITIDFSTAKIHINYIGA